MAKHLKQAGISFDCFEKGSALGGLWRYGNDSGTSAAYRNLQIDTSSQRLAYDDFPPQADAPEYMGHADVLAYIEAYAKAFDVADMVTFRTEVRSVRPVDDGSWGVTLSTGESRKYSHVVVANGHLSDPRIPGFAGRLSCEELHSKEYTSADVFEGKRVLVVGMGNSACDIAVDLARQASQVYLSTRRSAWILPKFILGRPTDQWSTTLAGKFRLPTPVTRTIVKGLAYLATGSQARYGVPKPVHPIYREHATISQELLPYVGYGWIDVRPNVKRFDSNRVTFTDGTSTEVDVVIYATGYNVHLPFLDQGIRDSIGDGTRLYRRIVAPQHPELLFAGLIQPVGATIPLVGKQAQWVAALITGDLALPGSDAMEQDIQSASKETNRFVDSERYRLEVDAKKYAKLLARDVSGARRSRVVPRR